jgi:CheY-like chemotaxis protein
MPIPKTAKTFSRYSVYMNALINKTILIVDDDADTRDLMRLVLEDAGAKVITAESVEEALRTYRKSPPHGVVTDIRLGSSDGYALITAIRKNDEEYRGFTTVVAVTGFGSPEDKTRALAAGFNAYITKPFEVAEVLRTLGKLLEPATDSAA